jgi:hypothetical protein
VQLFLVCRNTTNVTLGVQRHFKLATLRKSA